MRQILSRGKFASEKRLGIATVLRRFQGTLKMKKDGLWVKKTENAPMVASTME